jgi:hypothetical protein
MTPSREAAAHSLGFISSEGGRLLKNDTSYTVMDKVEVIEKCDYREAPLVLLLLSGNSLKSHDLVEIS